MQSTLKPRRSARLVGKQKPIYMEGAPSRAETQAYSDTLTPLFAQQSALPSGSPERVAHIVRIFETLMTPMGSRVVAYHPMLRVAIWGAMRRICDEAYALPAAEARAGRPIFGLTGRLGVFLEDVKKEECYRASYGRRH
jgi:hypothetical protein